MDIRLVKLYVEKFIKGKLNFHDITLIPTIEEKGGRVLINWEMENPNNISYTRFAVRNFIEASLEEFFNVTGYEVDSPLGNRRGWIRKNYINMDDSIQDIYISSKMQRTIEDKLREEVVVGFGNYQLKVEGFDYDISSYHEELTVEISMMILEVVYKKLDAVLNEEEVKQFLSKVFSDGSEQDLYDALSWHISSVLYHSPTIFDQDEMYMRDLVTFFDENKDIIEFNWG